MSSVWTLELIEVTRVSAWVEIEAETEAEALEAFRAGDRGACGIERDPDRYRDDSALEITGIRAGEADDSGTVTPVPLPAGKPAALEALERAEAEADLWGATGADMTGLAEALAALREALA